MMISDVYIEMSSPKPFDSSTTAARISSPSATILSSKDLLKSSPRTIFSPNTYPIDSTKNNLEISFDSLKSPSAHSLTSSFTSDSGFHSGSVFNMSSVTLSRSPNSAFSPRMKLDSYDGGIVNGTTESKPRQINKHDYYKPDIDYSKDDEKNELKNNTVSFRTELQKNPHANTYSHDEPEENLSESYMNSRVSSYSTMPRSLRRKKYADRHKQQTYESEEFARGRGDHKSESSRVSAVSSPGRTRIKSKTDALLKNFIEKAEERDRRARREQRSLSRNGIPRTRSASATRSGSVRESSSTGSMAGQYSCLKRSNSSVDLQKIIKEAEGRDRKAFLDQASLEGIVPIRHGSPPKDPVKVHKWTPALSLIQMYEKKQEELDTLPYNPSDQEFPGNVQYQSSLPSSPRYKDLNETSRVKADDYFLRKSSQTLPYKKRSSSVRGDSSDRSHVARYTPRYREYAIRNVSGIQGEKKGCEIKTVVYDKWHPVFDCVTWINLFDLFFC